MAKFEGNYPHMPKEAPVWFKTFYDNYAFVIKFLNFAGKRGLNFNDNILSSTVSGVFKHNTATTIKHNIGVAPTAIIPQGGRYLSYKIEELSIEKIRITTKLLSTPVTSTTEYSNINTISVLDSSIFVIGDSVKISSYERTITQIIGNQLVLDAGVVLTLPNVVALNSETLNFVIF